MKPTARRRRWALVIVIIILAMAVLALFISTQSLDPIKLFGVCGFEQRHNMPCPFCGMTRSVCMFVRGDIIGSVKMQPAAAAMCVAITFTFFYNAARACGYEMTAVANLLKRIRPLSAVTAVIIIILIGWAVAIYNYSLLE